MHNILIYTFRTFPWIEDLEKISKDIVTLGKLKIDIKKVEEMARSGKYSLILGIARANRAFMFETQGVNRFNKNKILLNGPDKFILDYPEGGYKNIGINISFTTSFCNWGMYQISNFLENEKLDIDHSFVHIKENDIDLLRDYLEENIH